MNAVTGPPDGMVDVRGDLTPMLSQYFDLCRDYEDSLVLFQNGDFYQTYCEAAEETSRVCEVTLTQREDSTGTYPMAGIPIDNAATYLERLLDAGYRVALAEQVEDPDATSGLVDRAVTQVITPGTVVEDELLDAGTTNYVAAVAEGGETTAVAVVDVSTGDCRVTSSDAAARLRQELDRLAPSEVLLGPAVGADTALPSDPMVTDVDPETFDREAAVETLSAYAPRPTAVVANDAELRACGAVLAYAEYTQGDDGPLEYVSRITRYDPREFLALDATALRSLELFENRGAGAGRTLFDVLDDTACALGRRRLEAWLRRPLLDREAIEARHDAVEEFTDRSLARDEVRDRLREAYDVERLIGRVSRGRANARDLRSLKATLDVIPEIRDALADVESGTLTDLRESLPDLSGVRDLIDRAIRPDPPVEVTDGGVVRNGFDDELDDLRRTEREGREWVADLEASERDRTGIDSLEVGYNQVHGYYIEVTNPNLDRVPDDYTRRQTLKNAERFYTPELKRREDEILGAAERADSLEYDIFCDVRSQVADEADRIQAVADTLATLDALATLAAVAVENDYVRPEFGGDGIDIEAGRHPVVEQAADFVPNDADLPRGSVAVVTGPNMSGKSTYMRQVALVVVLAQMGSFVPADRARLPVVDRVFTRVGASDDIAGGQSTFMREMAELTDILHGATDRSLVLLDEVGRGTSTADGLAIARATSEFVHDEIGATTLFATHYHELTGLAEERERVVNLHFAADCDGVSEAGASGDASDATPPGDVTFLHRVAEGAASSSYGIEVARMAGVPDDVVDRAYDLVDERETEDVQATLDEAARRTNGHAGTERSGTDSPAVGEAGGGADADERLTGIVRDLEALDVATTTPLEALNTLADFKRRLDDDD
ncbi:DNA mismatch repair protein MutS [Salinirarus marinus]|uniref:DNA mismatch repair protein MutS n=1 Tax=Salinirarus marinus TaxID=3068310 RepID=UPI003C6C96A3